jgi:CubicO group peptidase (beta-lactamase class C family)
MWPGAVALAAALAIAPQAVAAAEGLSSAAIAKIGAAARQFITDGCAPGISVAVVRDGHILFAKAYGMENLETGTPATSATVFRVGSITKEFTAAAIMLLAQNGKLSIDDQVSKYVPELASAGPLTLRMLLGQTSGLHDYTDTPASADFIRQRHTTKQMIDFIAAMKPLTDFEPGTKWAYSNTNYYVLGAIVERVSGLSLSDFLSKYVIAPANIRSTAVDREADVVLNRASGYVSLKQQSGKYRNAPFFSMDNAGGAGALRSNASDLARWQQALFSDRIVDAASLVEMTSPARLSDGTVAVRNDAPITLGPPNYGFGLELGSLDGIKAVGHAGAVSGFTAYLVTFPRIDTTLAIMSNGQHSKNFAEAFRAIERDVLHDVQN